MGTPPPPGGSSPPPSSPVLPSQSASPVHKSSWATLAKGNPMSVSDFQTNVQVENGTANLTIPAAVIDNSVPLWKCFVAGHFMGDAPHVGTIHATVNRIWTVLEKESRIDVQFINKTTVLFRKDSQRIREHVLKRRYWHIANVPLVINEWNPATAQAPPDLSTMPLWMDLKGVPAHLFSYQGLSFLSSSAGNFVKLHPNIERCLRLDVVRILVEVNLHKPLIDQICFPDESGNTVSVSVSYPWLPPHCALCSKWGHHTKDCSMKISILPTKGQQISRDCQPKDATSVVDQQTIQTMGQELIKDLERVPIYTSTSAPISGSITASLQDGENHVLQTVRRSIGVEGSAIEENQIVQQTGNT